VKKLQSEWRLLGSKRRCDDDDSTVKEDHEDDEGASAEREICLVTDVY
jgi:hypothetical protein